MGRGLAVEQQTDAATTTVVEAPAPRVETHRRLRQPCGAGAPSAQEPQTEGHPRAVDEGDVLRPGELVGRHGSATFPGRFGHRPYEADQTGQHRGAHGKGFGQPRVGKREADDRAVTSRPNAMASRSRSVRSSRCSSFLVMRESVSFVWGACGPALGRVGGAMPGPARSAAGYPVLRPLQRTGSTATGRRWGSLKEAGRCRGPPIRS